MIKKIFYPLSFLWEGIYSFRRFAYRVEIFSSKKFTVPVISIGNISFGGTNKTPFTLFLSNILKERDKQAAIVMRGYKGKLEKSAGLLRKGNSSENVEEFGDEAILYSNSNPELDIIVGKKRSKNLEKFYDQVKSDVILLDDGFQHLKIKRDLDIVLLDSTMDISKYKAPPVGYLREGLSALKDADILVYSKSDQANPDKLKELKSFISPFLKKDIVEVSTSFGPIGVFNSKRQKVMELDSLSGKEIFSFCGIASPESFFNTLESLGAKISKKFIFRDHHFYSDKEIERMLKEGEREDTIFLTTEKDFVRIGESFKQGKIYYLGSQIKILEGFDELENKIQSVLHP